VAIDEQLAAYVREQWAVLVGDAKARCAGADDAEAHELVLGALTRVALRWRFADRDADLDGVVRRGLLRACRDRDKRRLRDGGRDIQLMEVGVADRAAETTLSAAPLPQLSPINPLAVLARRVSRLRRRRLVAASAGAAAVVAAAVTLVLSGSGGGHPHRKVVRAVAVPAPIAFPRASAAYPTGVAQGGGYLWTLELHPSSSRPGTTIVRRNLVTGRQEVSYQMPGEDFGIAYGLGRVWAWGVDDSRPHVSAVSSLDPKTSAVHAVRMGKGGMIASAAFTGDYGWFTQPEQNRVLLVAPRADGTMVTVEVAGARNVASVSATSVVVSGTSGVIQELPANLLVEPGAAFPTLLSSTPSYGVWIGHDNRLGYQSDISAPPSVQLGLPLSAGVVAGDPAHGVYVATRSDDPLHYDPYLLYYSPAALKAPRPRSTARLDGREQVESMVSGQNGGIVFVTTDGSIESWNPSSVG
jgi:hypothetical protein